MRIETVEVRLDDDRELLLNTLTAAICNLCCAVTERDADDFSESERRNIRKAVKACAAKVLGEFQRIPDGVSYNTMEWSMRMLKAGCLGYDAAVAGALAVNMEEGERITDADSDD